MKHFIERYKQKITELEGEVVRLGRALTDSMQAEHEAINALMPERRKNRLLGAENETQKRALRQLQGEKSLLENRLKQHEELLRKYEELNVSFAEVVKENTALRKKLNLRSAREKALSLAMPSSTKVFRKNSPPENQARTGGAVKGHTGHGRRIFSPSEADRIEYNNDKPAICSCGNDNWILIRTETHCFHEFIPARLIDVYAENTRWKCGACGRHEIKRGTGIQPHALYDVKTMAYLLNEIYHYNVPLNQISHRRGLNPGTVLHMAHRVAAQFEEPLFKRILENIRHELLVYADETRWRVDGLNAYCWSFSNDHYRIFLFRRSRAGKIPVEVFGLETLPMTLVTDRYAGYNPLPVKRQLCYVHLLRDIKKEQEKFPDDPELKTFCPALAGLLKKAIAMFESELPVRQYRSRCRKLKNNIMKLCNSDAVHPAVRKLQDIFREREDSLFQWCRSPDIPAENNFAERSVRPVVIMRKISFGSQSEQGMRTREILSTVMQTAAARGYDVFEFMVKAITATTKAPPPDLYQSLMPIPRP